MKIVMNTSAIKNEIPVAPQHPVWFTLSIRNPQSAIRNSRAFTLIELLVVISIIGVLAALTIPVLTAIKKTQYLSHANAELAQLEAAIGNYHDARGFYPPDCANGPLTNQLYYELGGTAYNSTTKIYTSLDGSSSMPANDVPLVFGAGVGGFMNSSQPGGGEDAVAAKNFLPELKSRQYATISVSGKDAKLLLCSVGGPDQTYSPLGGSYSGFNPWRYLANGTNNPGGYDLWVQLQIKGKKYLICNWSKQVQVNNNSLP